MKDIEDIVIVGAGRTAIGKFGGTLKDKEVIDLGASVIPEVLKRAQVNSEQVDLVTWGHCRTTGYEGDTGRLAAVVGSIPVEVPAFTINMACVSSMRAVICGIQAIKCNEAEIVLSGGMESMSNQKYLLDGAVRWGVRSGSMTLIDEGYVPPRICEFGMGGTAENVAEKYSISREDQDKLSCESHQRAITAQNNGWFDDEIVHVTVNQPKGKQILFSKDECIRSDTTMDRLATLPAIFREGGTVTAGNSCPLSDGASALVLTSRKKAQELGLKPLASFLSYHTAAVDPAYMGIGPIVSVPGALNRAGLKLNDIDLIEHNEAFASVVVAAANVLGYDMTKVNVNGGAIAIGHPTGNTGARLIVTLYHALKRTGGEIGMATLCGGTGVTGTVIIKREN